MLPSVQAGNLLCCNDYGMVDRDAGDSEGGEDQSETDEMGARDSPRRGDWLLGTIWAYKCIGGRPY